MNKGNYLFLGIASSYFVIAVVQWTTQGSLPMSLYISIAWVSLEVAILEFMKTIFQYLQAIHTRQIKITQDELEICDKHISVMGKYDTLRAEVERHMEFRPTLVERAKKLNGNKSIRILGKVTDGLSIVQIIFGCITVSITSLKRIPNDLASNKVVGVLSLLAFAFLMLSYFVKGSIEPVLNESELTIRNVDMIENYYLDMLEKAAPKEDDNDNK